MLIIATPRYGHKFWCHGDGMSSFSCTGLTVVSILLTLMREGVGSSFPGKCVRSSTSYLVRWECYPAL